MKGQAMTIPADGIETRFDTGETETKVRVWHGTNRHGVPGVGVTVTVRCLPGYRWWTCPDARTIRRLVDQTLTGTGYARIGRRDPINGGPLSEWRFRYFVGRCEYVAADNHSNDLLTVQSGDAPHTLCGFHATYFASEALAYIRANQRRD